MINTRKKKLAIFDIDGTLTDSVPVHQEAFKGTLRDFSLFNYNENFSSYKHHTDLYIANEIFKNQNSRDMTNDEINLFEEKLLKRIIHLLNGVNFKQINKAIDFVHYLDESTDYAIAYATGSFKTPAKLKLTLGFPRNEDQYLFACNNEPSREGIVGKAIEQSKYNYGLDNFEKMIAFGDGLWDLQAAKQHSVEFIGIGENSRDLFDKEIPCYMDYVELIKAFPKL
jgi:beta-phosphoglucomutase-like phosphatase (HAD superfamily)